MPKLYTLVFLLLFIGFIFALLSAFVYLTRAANIQSVIFQNFYWSSDRAVGIGGVLVYLFVTFVSGTIAMILHRKLSSEMNIRWLGGVLLISLCGLLIGLVIHHVDACCDTPVIYYFGFPLSFVRGVTSSWHSLPYSETIYLVRNFENLRWLLAPWNFIINFVFWFNVGFILFSISKLKMSLLPKRNS